MTGWLLGYQKMCACKCLGKANRVLVTLETNWSERLQIKAWPTWYIWSKRTHDRPGPVVTVMNTAI